MYNEACEIFSDSEIQISIEGRCYLGGSIGTTSFTEAYAKTKVTSWTEELLKLSEIANSQAHTAYAAFTHGLKYKWTFLSKVCKDIEHLFKPLEKIIRQKLLPALTGRNEISDTERELMALPVRLGGIDISDPTSLLTQNYDASKKITAPLNNLMKKQATVIPPETNMEIINMRKQVSLSNSDRMMKRSEDVAAKLNPPLQRSMSLAKDKGGSSWLSVLPIEEHGFTLNKGEFRDAICMRYGWRPKHLPTRHSFDIEHALSCKRGGFIIKRHNELRYITAGLLSEVCKGVGTEPTLQPLSNEVLSHRSANREDGARLDIVAEDFWGHKQHAFFDVRVFNPLAPSLRASTIQDLYRQKEQEKRRAYNERVREVKHGSFTPLIFSTSGGMGPAAEVTYKRLASMIAEHQKKSYSTTINFIRCRLSFSLIRSAVLCLRGYRSIY